MKKITQILLLLVIFSAPAKAEMFNMEMSYKTTTAYYLNGYNYKKYVSETITTNIPSGFKFKLINIYTNSSNLSIGGACSIKFKPSQTSNLFSYTASYEVEGPAQINFILPDSSSWMTDYHQEPSPKSSALFSYEINQNSSLGQAANATISSASVVVPSNAVGDVDVLLEQSNDMITWTQCLPGTYNASTQKRFFRVRAVEK